jgi:hypothetical protein
MEINVSKIPAIVTLRNATEMPQWVQLYGTSTMVLLEAGDIVTLLVTSSAEATYWLSMPERIFEVSIGDAPELGAWQISSVIGGGTEYSIDAPTGLLSELSGDPSELDAEMQINGDSFETEIEIQ